MNIRQASMSVIRAKERVIGSLEAAATVFPDARWPSRLPSGTEFVQAIWSYFPHASGDEGDLALDDAHQASVPSLVDGQLQLRFRTPNGTLVTSQQKLKGAPGFTHWEESATRYSPAGRLVRLSKLDDSQTVAYWFDDQLYMFSITGTLLDVDELMLIIDSL